ncbi:ABC transporter ATP-binding protein [Clostridium sp.]|uniref:ABC transporter ATP-binding protein n=1 Tax=Clostridium sp. TaxID=1506 RepID=UPI002638F5C5|nr:ABC transporter ATP-binding protein [Clostridium sp.]
MIETSHLTKQFNGKGGFKDISLSIKEGEVFSFLGKNGAGKSTFIKTLLGLLKLTDGKAEVLGKPIGDVDARKKIGYLPELFQYHSWLTGYELLTFHGKLYKMSSLEIKKRIPEVLQIVGLSGHENKKIKEYSKGMQQRIGLGCAIISDPLLLFLDEPTSALDPVGRKQVRDIILNLKKQGKTIFLNTHLLSEVELISDRIAILDKGKIQKIGTIKELLHSPLLITLMKNWLRPWNFMIRN